ncbi:MAG: cytochrome c oxidase accessory protein CcoG [Gammaproteobacteria bacterium]|nr:cytochrome c oxidase accessory protein CcoG [Gammaproteobacteria bacterium]MDH5729309.1 cytochrome c oxidase accessory protein CcoG [Gammaproteobacteria bacterium]
MESKDSAHIDQSGIDSLYAEIDYWHVNTGEQTIHAKRMPGRFRTIKWITSSVWILFFLGPYLRWNGQQAVLFDIAGRQFHIFNLTILPQDIWMLALVLLFFSLLLAAVTSIAGRVYCGYFCFQTVWTDVFIWLEEKLEGHPSKRMKLDKAPWNFYKIRIKTIKHILWLVIGVLTGISFTLWFADAYTMWASYFSFDAPMVAWITVGTFTFFTYLFAGHMREQVCFWLCPYARIQGVMADATTIMPTYDLARGEPRGKLKKKSVTEGGQQGDCIDCKQCVAVCPTGIDIRNGQQEGCITCALCIDACDAVMDKISRPHGLIRYASLKELDGAPALPLYKRPRVIVYFSFLALILAGLIYGITHLGFLELKILHERQPLYVQQSDGSIQNKYVLKILNKTDQVMSVNVSATGLEQLELQGVESAFQLSPGRVNAFTVFIRVAPEHIHQGRTAVDFVVHDINQPDIRVNYQSMFFAPNPP